MTRAVHGGLRAVARVLALLLILGVASVPAAAPAPGSTAVRPGGAVLAATHARVADVPSPGADPTPAPDPVAGAGTDVGPSATEPDVAAPPTGGLTPQAEPPAGGSTPQPEPPAPGARFAWPLAPRPAVVTPFRAPAHAFGPGHRGVDLAGVAGQPVLAARGGTVAFAGPVAGRGVVSVQHDDGLRTTYEPVTPTVAVGAVVRTGDVLGRLGPGHGGCAPATCLHWGVLRDRVEYLDPLVLLRPARVRLLPVPDPWPGPPDA